MVNEQSVVSPPAYKTHHKEPQKKRVLIHTIHTQRTVVVSHEAGPCSERTTYALRTCKQVLCVVAHRCTCCDCEICVCHDRVVGSCQNLGVNDLPPRLQAENQPHNVLVRQTRLHMKCRSKCTWLVLNRVHSTNIALLPPRVRISCVAPRRHRIHTSAVVVIPIAAGNRRSDHIHRLPPHTVFKMNEA